jgi:hypothetical protein
VLDDENISTSRNWTAGSCGKGHDKCPYYGQSCGMYRWVVFVIERDALFLSQLQHVISFLHSQPLWHIPGWSQFIHGGYRSCLTELFSGTWIIGRSLLLFLSQLQHVISFLHSQTLYDMFLAVWHVPGWSQFIHGDWWLPVSPHLIVLWYMNSWQSLLLFFSFKFMLLLTHFVSQNDLILFWFSVIVTVYSELD